MGRTFLMRGLGLLVAVVVCAWFAVGIRQAHDTSKATAIVSGANRLNGAQAERAASLLRAAGFLNPDTEVDLLRAQLARDLSERQRAEQILAGVVRKEPLNVRAWVSLAANATTGTTYIHALREIALLVPKQR